MILSVKMSEARSTIIWPILGLSYLLTFFTGHAVGIVAALYLLWTAHRRPSFYDLIPLFLIVDIFPIHVKPLFVIPLMSTIVFNAYFVKIVFFALKYGSPKMAPTVFLCVVIIVSAWRGLDTLSTFSSVTAFRDLKTILAVTFALGLFRADPARIFSLDRTSLADVAYFFVGVAISIVIYVAFFNTTNLYVILDTAKSIIGFATLYAVLYSSIVIAAMIAALNFFVLVLLSTRMNFLIITVLFIALTMRKAPIFAIAATVVGALAVVWAADFSLPANRIATMLNIFAEPSRPSLGPVLSRLAELDYVRAVEAHYTFQRATIAELLFGRGLGTGFQDSDGYITAAYILRDAFTLEEFRSGTFFGLHDPIVEWTFRYGLIVSAALCAGLLLMLYRGVKNRDLLPILTVLLILTAYWSGKGVALIALIGFLTHFSVRPSAFRRAESKHGKRP